MVGRRRPELRKGKKKMKRKNRKEMIDDGNVRGFVAALMFVAGLAFGGVISAVVMLLVAPQSGRKTRRQIRRKGKELRHQASEAVDDTVAQVRAKTRQVSARIQDKAEALQERGQEAVDQQKERWAPVVKAAEKAAANGA
jgi:gas vesicle protein